MFTGAVIYGVAALVALFSVIWLVRWAVKGIRANQREIDKEEFYREIGKKRYNNPDPDKHMPVGLPQQWPDRLPQADNGNGVEPTVSNGIEKRADG